MTLTGTATIGRFTLTTLVDGYFAADPAFIPAAGSVEGQALFVAAGLPPAGPSMEPVNAFAIERDGRLWLIDSGVGRDASADFGHVPDALRGLGYAAEDVETIVLTHLHEDHIGGLVQGGRRAYPNARLIMPDREPAFWTDPAAPMLSREPRMAFEQARAVLETYEGRVETVSGTAPFAQGLSFLPLYGHTPGHSGVMIEDGGQRLLMWADITHSSMLQLVYPDWTIGRDNDPEAAAATRHALLADIAGTGLRVAGSHQVGIGTVVRADPGYAIDAGRNEREPAA